MEFKEFYKNELVPSLEGLEVERKKYFALAVAVSIIGVVCAIFSLVSLSGIGKLSIEELGKENFIIGLLILVFWSALGALIYKKVFYSKLQLLRTHYKRLIIRRIVMFADPELKYFEEQQVTQDEYEASKLFPVKAHYYYGEDYMLGRSGKVQYKFSEVHSQYVMKDHRGRKAFFTIFKGLFFIAKMNQNFASHTVVLPDKAGKYFGKLGKFVNQWNIFRDEMVLINEDFDKQFVVYSDNAQETKSLLNKSLTARITEFRKKTNHEVLISFVDNNVNVAIPLTKDLFEPPVIGTMIEYKSAFESYQYIKLLVDIVTDLGLDKRNGLGALSY